MTHLFRGNVDALAPKCEECGKGPKAVDEEGYSLHKQNGGQTCDVADGPCACGAWH